jgi:hypothetical protein
MAFKKFDSAKEREFQRQMHDVSGMNIKCRDCGTAIDQLPFQPDPARLDTIRCQDCMRKYRESRPRRF